MDAIVRIVISYERSGVSMSRSWVLKPEDPQATFSPDCDIQIIAVQTACPGEETPAWQIALDDRVVVGSEDSRDDWPVRVPAGETLRMELPEYRMPSAYEIVAALDRHPRLRERVRALLGKQ